MVISAKISHKVTFFQRHHNFEQSLNRAAIKQELSLCQPSEIALPIIDLDHIKIEPYMQMLVVKHWMFSIIYP